MPAAVPASPPSPRLSAPASRPAENRGVAQSLQAKAADNVAADAAATTIQLRRWTPDAPYIARLRDATAADLYRVYLDTRPGYANSTAFFLDAADVFFERAQSALGVRVLSNLAEMDLENRHILRILGQRLMQAERPKLALPVFRKVLELSPEEPQSYRDLGLAYAADGQHQIAIDTLREVVVRPWHGRFPEVELITLAELNAIVATSGETLDTSRIDRRLLKNLPLALRVVLAWDADNTDIDLWVTDPNGERAFYGNRLTYQGGRMSQDFTGGYGPEEFSLKHAKPGKYRIEAQFYGNRQQIVAGATTLQVKLATGFGTAAQKEQSVTLRLKERQEVVFVGEFDVGAAD
jgi:tetratricopeptide (TPR) repeat protein